MTTPADTIAAAYVNAERKGLDVPDIESDAVALMRQRFCELLEAAPYGTASKLALKLDVTPQYVNRMKQGTATSKSFLARAIVTLEAMAHKREKK
jgi:hypothetical protein